MLVLALPGCATQVGAAGSARPAAEGRDGPAVCEVSDEGEATRTGPTERLVALREEVEQARAGGALDGERCVAWADELIALHVRHGEPYVRARLDAAALLRECGRPGDAWARLAEALDAMPRWARAEAENLLGVLAHEAGDEGGAIALLQAALHHDPALHEARGNLVRVLLRIYDGGGSDFARDDIRANLEAWLELAPDDPRVRVQLAAFEVIRARREPAAAEDARREAELRLLQVLREDPSPAVVAEVWVVRGRLWLDEGDEPTALRAFERALELDPSRSAAALMGATARLRMRDFEGARRMLEAAAATVEPVEEPTRLRLLAVALRGVRRYDEAREIYERLLAVERPEPVDLYNRAELERHVLAQEDAAPDATRVTAVRERFAAVVAATRGDPRHAEVEQRAQAELRVLDDRLAALRQPTPPGADVDETLDFEARERQRGQRARRRSMEREAAEREARERRRFGGQ